MQRFPAYSRAIRGSAPKHRPTVWRWPAVWALLLAFVLQMLFGLPATGLSLFLLVAADHQRCPVAVGADSHRPLYAWFVGACLAITLCERMTAETARHNSSSSWVLWGSVAEIWRYFLKRPD